MVTGQAASVCAAGLTRFWVRHPVLIP